MPGDPTLRAIRGATQVDADDASQILAATRELLAAIVDENGLAAADLMEVLFTATPDLRATFPAEAARELGWTDVPLLCSQEMDVTDGLPRCIRVLLRAHTARSRSEVRHVYLRGARALRPDLAAG
ncbi:MAG: chorismate mutase [Gemmatimonadetes bacterium]|nr:chorismate mutase [Gemmatimonadota bacterium]